MGLVIEWGFEMSVGGGLLQSNYANRSFMDIREREHPVSSFVSPHFLQSTVLLHLFRVCLTGVSILSGMTVSFTMLVCDHLIFSSVLNIFQVDILYDC